MKYLVVAFLVIASHTAIAQQAPSPYTETRQPCVNFDDNKLPFFGDTHVHTGFSFDAAAQDTRATAKDAYSFAQGNPMGIQPYDADGKALRTIQLDRPLDFTAVTDHAEFLGEVNMCNNPDSGSYWHPACFAHRYSPISNQYVLAAYGLVMKKRWGFCEQGEETCEAARLERWQFTKDAAEEAYDRSADCNFTSFIGYEWTATVGSGRNLHRNVIFKNFLVPDRPTSWIETPSAANLWQVLQKNCVEDKPGCDAITIPHNSNLSGGLMFESAEVSSEELPDVKLTKATAKLRSRWEPLHEMMQHKGSSECDNRRGWIEDEFCGFEKMHYDTFGGKNTGDNQGGQPNFIAGLFGIEHGKTQTPSPSNFIRYGLKKGLKQQAEIGENSFKFGLTAATDTHIGAPGQTSEQGHPGHGGAGMGAKEGVVGLPDELEFGPGGLTVLWAKQNTREALFEAMRNREAYGTSGTRPILRFFAGWNYDNSLCGDPDMVKKAYAGGVPMGSDLSNIKEAGATPKILVSALQDPGTPGNPGTGLQRIQVIKGWYSDGELHEKVLDVAGGENSASVDTQTCERQGTGHANLCSVWQDDDFDDQAPAFYYARVLENPSCRWSQYQCVAAKVNCEDPATIMEGFEGCCSTSHKLVQQERAWSSPIWYTP